MAIFNTGNGGSALQYTVKVQKDRPTITGSKKVIWIKDDLTFLNPYDNEKNEKLDIMTTLRAYKNAADEKSKNECNATFVHTTEKNSAFIHLDKSLYVSNTILGCTLSTTNKYLKVTIPAKAGTPETGVKLKIGFSDQTFTEGSMVIDIVEKTLNYSDSTQTFNMSPEELLSSNGAQHRYMYIIYDLEAHQASTYGAITVRGYSNAEHTSPTTEAKAKTAIPQSLNNGTFVNNCIIADLDNDLTTAYFKTDSQKGYRIYPNNNLYYLFSVTSIPEEGKKGSILTSTSPGVYYSKDDNYYLIDGSKHPYVCCTYKPSLDNIPYILDGTFTRDFQIESAEGATLTSLYPNNQGYMISPFMPTKLEENNQELSKEDRYFWIISGNNKNIHFDITKSPKKKNYISLEGVVARLPYSDAENNIIHSILYFLKAEFWNGEKWIPLKGNANQLFNLEALLEGSLEEIYYDENESLRPYAFYKYDKLKSINFPNCEILEENAFVDCVNLSVVNLPKWSKYLTLATGTDNYIDTNYFYSNKTVYSPFKGCSDIVKANIGFLQFRDGTYNKAVVSAASPFFQASNKLKELTISNCSLIGSYTFYSYQGLEKLILGDNLSVNINQNAFGWCKNLREIVNNDQINSIGTKAFQGCTNLDNLNLLKTRTIYDGAFSGCTLLTNILDEEQVKEYGPALQSIGQNAFFNTNISTLYAPNCINFGTTTVKGYNINSTPISGCANLQSITLGWNLYNNTIPAIFQGTNFPNLAYVSLSAVSSLATDAFKAASRLSTVFLSSQLNTIPNTAFYNCGYTALTRFPMQEKGYSVYEFKYEPWINEDGQQVYEQKTMGTDEPSKIKYKLVGTDDNGQNIYEPMVTENNEYIYVITDNPKDLYQWKIVDYTYYNNETESDQLDDYYLPEYDYENGAIYDTNAPKTDYSKIQYESFIPDFSEEGDSRKEKENNKTLIYTKNNRIVIEDEEYNKEYDDFVYSYIINEDGTVTLGKAKKCYYLFDQCVDDEGKTIINCHQAEKVNEGALSKSDYIVAFSDNDEDGIEYLYLQKIGETSDHIVAFSDNDENAIEYLYSQKIGETNVSEHEVAVPEVKDDIPTNYLYSHADANSGISNDHILVHSDNYLYNQKIDNLDDHEVIVQQDSINYVYKQLTGDSDFDNHIIAINNYLYNQAIGDTDTSTYQVAVIDEDTKINYLYNQLTGNQKPYEHSVSIPVSKTQYWYNQATGITNVNKHIVADANGYLYNQEQGGDQPSKHIVEVDGYRYHQKMGITNSDEHEVANSNGYLYKQKTGSSNPYSKQVAVVDDDGISWVYHQARENGEYLEDENGNPKADMKNPVIGTTPIADTENPVIGTTPIANTNSPIANTNSPIADTKSPIADTKSPVIDLTNPVADTTKPIADLNSPVYDLTKPKLKKAVYDVQYAYDRIVNADGSPVVNEETKEIIYNEVTAPHGLEYINKLTGKGNTWNPTVGVMAWGLMSVGNQGFAGCINLKEIYLQDYLNPSPTANGYLNSKAFNNCSSLSIVDAPYVNRMSLGKNAITDWPFANCSNLVSLNLSNYQSTTVFGNVFVNSYPLLEDVKLNNITILQGSAFAGKSSFRIGTFNSCTTVQGSAFSNTNIGYITTDENLYGASRSEGYISNMDAYRDVWSIKDESFKQFINTDLENRSVYSNIVTLPALVLSYSNMYNTKGAEISTFDGIFQSCHNLRGGYLGEKIAVIPKETFQQCYRIEKISQSMNIDGEYNCLYIPNVSIIGANAFKDCGYTIAENTHVGISQISFADVLTTIQSGAFQNCLNLQKVTFHSEISSLSIGENAFNNCINLSVVKDIPTTLTAIGSYAFTANEGTRNQKLKLDFTNFSEEDEVPTITADTFPLISMALFSIYFSNDNVKTKFAGKDDNWFKYQSYMTVTSNFDLAP